MTPANKLAETVKQVTKIVKSPGCKYVHYTLTVGLPILKLTRREGKPPFSLIRWRLLWRPPKCSQRSGQYIFVVTIHGSTHYATIIVCSLCPIFRISNVTGDGLDLVSLSGLLA